MILRFAFLILPLALAACAGRTLILTPREHEIYTHSADDCEYVVLREVDGLSNESRDHALKQLLSNAALIGASGLIIQYDLDSPTNRPTYQIRATAYRCVP